MSAHNSNRIAAAIAVPSMKSSEDLVEVDVHAMNTTKKELEGQRHAVDQEGPGLEMQDNRLKIHVVHGSSRFHMLFTLLFNPCTCFPKTRFSLCGENDKGGRRCMNGGYLASASLSIAGIVCISNYITGAFQTTTVIFMPCLLQQGCSPCPKDSHLVLKRTFM